MPIWAGSAEIRVDRFADSVYDTAPSSPTLHPFQRPDDSMRCLLFVSVTMVSVGCSSMPIHGPNVSAAPPQTHVSDETEVGPNTKMNCAKSLEQAGVVTGNLVAYPVAAVMFIPSYIAIMMSDATM